MIKNPLDKEENKKDQLSKLKVRILRQEAKKLSIPLYSRKNKALLVDLILKYQKKALIENKTKIERELKVDQNCKVNSEGSKNKIFYEHSKLKRLLSKSFPDKEITVKDNKDGSQTILIK
ncbi:hypothetical protein [Prochlorococcus sp. MIT 1314]|uniref:hypothetical protein n=1 Tax=Prochlorococcus sp. MIT 1314 TaxID=3096220 RepID=UPI002A752345|nr:hypothetical protein [Prochlorococcus sp. MIT 1314]